MKKIENKLQLLLLPLALCGFAVAQPVYNLLLETPVFLVARQNTPADVWTLVLLLSFILPLVLVSPALFAFRRYPVFASWWCWAISSICATLFVAQLLQQSAGPYWLLYVGSAIAAGMAIAWTLLFTRWSMLGTVLAAMAALFPVWFLLFSPVLKQIEDYATVSMDQSAPEAPLPDIVFVLLDQLPMATLVDGKGQVDASLFPGFARLQSMSNWYFNTTSVSDGTVTAVPAILTSQFPQDNNMGITVADQPVNLFTMLRHHYDFNVVEAVTKLCPDALCPRVGSGFYRRVKALLLDVTAIYLHRVVPDRWVSSLPVVTDNWSGFLAEQQVFFPEGWIEHAGAQTVIDRPEFFRQFTRSIHKGDKPTLNFMHILFPHGPIAYFPSGENYGLAWMRGQSQETWGDVEWGIISGKQRYFLQVQYADGLLNEMLDHLQQKHMLNESMIVVVADHGVNVALNDQRRALSDTNQAALLRVPLFIKMPGQVQGRRIDLPAMTVDILPTMLTALGFAGDSLALDGVDLEAPASNLQRQRQASSYLDPELRVLNEADLDIDKIVHENRRHLKLDDPERALWEIGPYDSYRGQPLASVCEPSDESIRVSIEGFSELPSTRPENSLPAYVVGTFSGEAAGVESKPFLISSNGLLVASGHSWILNEQNIFFALVEPQYVKQKSWDPEVWLLKDGVCLGRSKQ